MGKRERKGHSVVFPQSVSTLCLHTVSIFCFDILSLCWHFLLPTNSEHRRAVQLSSSRVQLCRPFQWRPFRVIRLTQPVCVCVAGAPNGVKLAAKMSIVFRPAASSELAPHTSSSGALSKAARLQLRARSIGEPRVSGRESLGRVATVCSVQCAVCSVQCAVCSVQCAVRALSRRSEISIETRSETRIAIRATLSREAPNTQTLSQVCAARPVQLKLAQTYRTNTQSVGRTASSLPASHSIARRPIVTINWPRR